MTGLFDDEGHEPLLSDEETSALLSAMREGDAGPAPQEVDLTSADGPLRAALGEADACNGALARTARVAVLRMSGAAVAVDPMPVEIVPRDVFESSLPSGSLRFAFFDGATRVGDVTVSADLCRYVLERAMGAKGSVEAHPGTEPTALSPLDRRLLRPLPESLTEDLAGGLLGGRALALEPLADELDPSDGRFQPVLRLGLRATEEGRPLGDVMIALEAPTIRLPGRAPASRTPAASSLRLRVALAEVELSAVLGRAASTVRELLALQVGDVLRLDGSPSEPVGLWVDDVLYARGAPVVHVGDLAIEVTDATHQEPAR